MGGGREEANLICRDQEYDKQLVNLLKESGVEPFAKMQEKKEGYVCDYDIVYFFTNFL